MRESIPDDAEPGAEEAAWNASVTVEDARSRARQRDRVAAKIRAGEPSRVLHVTESMGAGVLSSVEVLCRKQTALGAHVTVAFLSRFDTPTDRELEQRFPGVTLIRLDSLVPAGLTPAPDSAAPAPGPIQEIPGSAPHAPHSSAAGLDSGPAFPESATTAATAVVATAATATADAAAQAGPPALAFAPSRAGFLALARTVRRAATSGEYDAIHLHSSRAGVIGRLAILGGRRTASVFYSPHGFAFLREDLSPFTRRVATFVERMLAGLGDGLVLVSPSERQVAVEALGARNAFVLRNGISTDMLPARVAKAPGAPLVVAMVGRVTYQKGPWRFAEVARALENLAEFRWLGGGEPAPVVQWLGDAPVTVTGWMRRTELMQQLAEVDVLVFPSLWEGMPLALMEAQAMGIPAVASAVVGNVDVVVDLQTGYLVTTDAEFVRQTKLLLTDAALRDRLSSNARSHARSHLTDEHLGVESLALYAAARTPVALRNL